MKYDLMKVLEAVRACYVCDYNPLPVDEFIILFCERYGYTVEEEHRKIRRMLVVLSREHFVLRDDVMYLHNMLRSNIRLRITG